MPDAPPGEKGLRRELLFLGVLIGLAVYRGVRAPDALAADARERP